jgi:putative sigma-54 modulation protein
MISNIGIAGLNLELSDDIKKYISKKIGRLDKYIPRHARKTARAEVKLRETNNKHGNKYECEAIVRVPGGQVHAVEATLNMFAAVDIVEAKLKNQLLKYKQEHVAHLRERHPGVLGRLRVHLMK